MQYTSYHICTLHHSHNQFHYSYTTVMLSHITNNGDWSGPCQVHWCCSVRVRNKVHKSTCTYMHVLSGDCNERDHRVSKFHMQGSEGSYRVSLRVKFTAKHTLHDSFQLEWKIHTTLIGASGEYAIIMVGQFLRKREHHNHRHRYISAHSGIELQNR